MPDATGWAVLLAAALAASVVGGVAGFGTGIIMLPIIAWAVGLRETVPILTVTMLIANGSRVWWSLGDVQGRVAAAFLVGAVPATALGAALYVSTPSEWLARIIGGFLLAAVPLRRVLGGSRLRLRLAHFPALGAGFGTLSALVVTTGPLLSPFFLAYGLRRGAYIGTEAVCAAVMHVTRGVALARYALLTWQAVAIGVALGATMFVGTWVGRRLLDRLDERRFLWAVEALLVMLGLQFLLFPR